MRRIRCSGRSTDRSDVGHPARRGHALHDLPAARVTARCTSDTEKPERNRPGLRCSGLAVWPRPADSAAVGQRAPGGRRRLQPVLQAFRTVPPGRKAQAARLANPRLAGSTAGGASQGWRGTAGSAAWASGSWSRAPARSFENGDRRTPKTLVGCAEEELMASAPHPRRVLLWWLFRRRLCAAGSRGETARAAPSGVASPLWTCVPLSRLA